MTSEQKTIEDFIKEVLADYLGLEPDDINLEDVLTEDLHMSAIDLSNISEILDEKEIDTTRLDITEVETVEDIVDAVSSKKYL